MSKRKKLLIVLLGVVFVGLLAVMVITLLSDGVLSANTISGGEKGNSSEPITEVVLVDKDNPDEPNNAPIVEETTASQTEQTTVAVQEVPSKKIDSVSQMLEVDQSIKDDIAENNSILYDGSIQEGTYTTDRLSVYADGKNILVYEYQRISDFGEGENDSKEGMIDTLTRYDDDLKSRYFNKLSELDEQYNIKDLTLRLRYLDRYGNVYFSREYNLKDS